MKRFRVGVEWLRPLRARLAMAACLAGAVPLERAGHVFDRRQLSTREFFSPAGYSISNGADGSLHVTAAGSPGTPADRLEKIALARPPIRQRAASEDVQGDARRGVVQMRQDESSTKVSKPTQADGLRVVAIDVTYGDDAPAAVRNTRETADALKAQLATETVPADVQSAATQEVAQQCRRSL